MPKREEKTLRRVVRSPCSTPPVGRGCISLGCRCNAVLLDVDGGGINGDDLCLADITQGLKAAVPRYTGARMARDNAKRVVERGALPLTVSGERMGADHLQQRSVVIGERSAGARPR